MAEHLREPEIINLLDLPYESEDELGNFLDEDDIDEEIGDEELFAKLDEVLTLPIRPNDAHDVSRPSEIDALELQGNAVCEDASSKTMLPSHTTNENVGLSIEPTKKRKINSKKPHKQQTSKRNRPTQNKSAKKNERPQQVWTHGNLEYGEAQTNFKGNYDLPKELSDLEHPYQFFRYFFDDELLSKMSAESLLYSTQKNPAKPKNLSTKDIEKFLGVIIFSSISNCTSLRDMWHPIRGNNTVVNCMGINTFDSMRSVLHFNDNTQQEAPTDPNRDRLYKLRPIIDRINSKSLSVPMRETLSIDEQTCATKTKHYLRLYNPNKPHKWGYKLYVLCDDKGFAHKFEIYSGQQETPLANEPDLGTTGNLVVRLAREVPRHLNHTIYCDNYYSSLQLFSYMFTQGIFMLGTFRRDRLPDCPFEDKSVMSKRERGSSDEWLTVVDDTTPISVVSWNDNQIVTIGSTLCGTLPLEKIKRYDRKTKTFMEISCPKIVKIYNKHMGGVDLMDSHIGRHHIRIKSKKWYFRLFYHLIDMVVVNSWILLTSKQEIKKMSQKDFRTELAVTLMTIGMSSTPKRGRPAGREIIEQEGLKRLKASAAPRPPIPVIKDKTDHWPVWDEKRNRCKMANCKGNTNVKCSKCNLNLCFHSKKNCFTMYHT